MSTTARTNAKVTDLADCHMHHVLAIEAASFANPLDRKALAGLLMPTDNYGIVALHPVGAWFYEKVVGYALLSMAPRRLWVRRLAVHPEWRHGDIGTDLLAECIAIASVWGRKSVALDVCQYNTPAHLFLKASGFTATGVHAAADGTTNYRFVFTRRGA